MRISYTPSLIGFTSPKLPRLACLMRTTIFALALRSFKPISQVLKVSLRLIVFMELIVSTRILSCNAKRVAWTFTHLINLRASYKRHVWCCRKGSESQEHSTNGLAWLRRRLPATPNILADSGFLSGAHQIVERWFIYRIA